MSNFETVSIVQAAQGNSEDRVTVVEQDESLLIVVADGAGGMGGGDVAAETVIREVTASAAQLRDAESCCELLRQIDFRVGAGQSTAVIACVAREGVFGASVGDSQAWLIREGEVLNLTHAQVRKPLLGSGECLPVGFSRGRLDSLLLVCTDGLANYVKQPDLVRLAALAEFSELPRKLVEMVRLPSGELWDDVGLVLCRRRRPSTRRKRYNVAEGLF
jgi:PPM family protein phosphatase